MIDGNKRHFLIHFFAGDKKYLRLLDLSKNKFKVISELNLGKGKMWSAHNDVIFVFIDNDIHAYDLDFRKIEHPLVGFLKRNLHHFGFYIRRIIFNKKYPFAVVINWDEKNESWDMWVVKWDGSKKYVLYKILDNRPPYNAHFSPDYDYFVFKRSIASDDKRCYLMKVDPASPCLLSQPVLLGQVPAYPPNITAWTTNPLSFVVSARDKLIRWNIEELASRDFKK